MADLHRAVEAQAHLGISTCWAPSGFVLCYVPLASIGKGMCIKTRRKKKMSTL